MSIQCHGNLDGLGIGHVKPLEHILYILGLTQESPFLHLLDLKTKEELQFTHHGHIKPLGHDPTKLFTKFIISRTKYNIININLANKDTFSISLNEESRIGFAYLKTVLDGHDLVGSLVQVLVEVEAVGGMACSVDGFRPKRVWSLVIIKHCPCRFNQCTVLPLNNVILLSSVWSREFMLDAFFI
jgi:hypothetical protein